jgi:SAM-dependent methyltransferase
MRTLAPGHALPRDPAVGSLSSWDRVAAGYAAAWDRPLRPVREAVLELAAPEVGMEVLEGASGPGLTTVPLAERVGSRGRVEATDLSPAMVARTRGAARARGLAQVRARQADLASLPFPGEVFHQAVSVLGVEFTADPDQALSELLRVTRPGGKVTVAVWGCRERVGWSEVLPVLKVQTGWEPPSPWFALGAGGALAGSLARAGGEAVVVGRVSVELVYAGAGAALEAIFGAGPAGIVEGMGRRAPAGGPGMRVREEWLRSLAPFRWKRGYRVPAEVVVARAIRSRAPAGMPEGRTGDGGRGRPART